jgi:hypothetical protein
MNGYRIPVMNSVSGVENHRILLPIYDAIVSAAKMAAADVPSGEKKKR